MSDELTCPAHSTTPPASPGAVDIERVTVPMIPLSLSKHRAAPWAVRSIGGEPEPTDGQQPTSVFLREYGDRGPDNRDKKVYASGVTPDLYRELYSAKASRFFDRFLAPESEGQGLPGLYLDHYFELYWDLHLGLTGEQIAPVALRSCQEFNLFLGLGGSTDEADIARREQARAFVRDHREELDAWIAQNLPTGDDLPPKRRETFAWLWLKNGMASADVIWEVFHNVLALSQWGNTIHQLIERLRSDSPSSEIRAAFEEAIAADAEHRVSDSGCPFGPLDRFVMEAFRTIVPNTGSLSARPRAEQSAPDSDEQVVVIHQHRPICHDPLHWSAPEDFRPDRFIGLKTTADIDAEECQRLGYPQCPFPAADFAVEGRATTLSSDGFGTVYSTNAGRTDHLVEHAGYAPFGFGYRRCPGELLTVEFIKDFLRRVHAEGIRFYRIPLSDAPTVGVELVALGAGNMVRNDVTFIRG